MEVNFTMVTRLVFGVLYMFESIYSKCTWFLYLLMLGYGFEWAQTFVYGDLYRYDIEKQEWKLISSPNSPPPRSAHQAVSWKNYLYIFGRYENLWNGWYKYEDASNYFTLLILYYNIFVCLKVVSSHLPIKRGSITTRWSDLLFIVDCFGLKYSHWKFLGVTSFFQFWT